MCLNYAASYSFGKDSYMAVKKTMEKYKIKPRAFIVSMKDEENSWTHGIGITEIEFFSRNSGIFVLPQICRIETYEKDFENGLKKLMDMFDITHCVFGDIFIKRHIEWNKKRCKNTGLKSIHPLSKYSSEEIIEEFLSTEIKSTIIKVDKNKLPESFLGRQLDRDTVNELKKFDIDICGEYGEYHTRVMDAPKSFK